jgi:hypothetical protein
MLQLLQVRKYYQEPGFIDLVACNNCKNCNKIFRVVTIVTIVTCNKTFFTQYVNQNRRKNCKPQQMRNRGIKSLTGSIMMNG